MKTHALRNSLLALLALGSLAIYILACTSFSPDDSKVLYTTYDPKAREFGVGIWDRTTGKSSLLFVPQQPGTEEKSENAALLRPQWLPDGRHVVVAWARGTEDDELTLGLLPVGQPDTTRIIQLKDVKEAALALTMPLAIAEGQFFYAPPNDESNTVIRVDLLTGEVARHVMPKPILAYATPNSDRVCYLSPVDGAKEKWEFGLLSPGTWGLKPLRQLEIKMDDDLPGLCAISPDGKWAVSLSDKDRSKVELRVQEDGKEKKRLRLARDGESLSVSLNAISTVNRVCYLPFLSTTAPGTNATFGVLEVPLFDAEPRRTTLVARLAGGEPERVQYAPASVSHDGKVLAVCTTLLACGDEALPAEDCGLFIVDLTDPKRGFKRVPTPKPPKFK